MEQPKEPSGDDRGTRRRVDKALSLMRKANVRPSKLELEMKKIDGLINTLSISKSEKKARTKKAKMNHEEVALYGNEPPIRLKSLEDIQKEAKANYTLASEMERIQSISKTIGKPRAIHVQLVEEIKEEEALRRETIREICILKKQEEERQKARKEEIINTIKYLREKRVAMHSPIMSRKDQREMLLGDGSFAAVAMAAFEEAKAASAAAATDSKPASRSSSPFSPEELETILAQNDGNIPTELLVTIETPVQRNWKQLAKLALTRRVSPHVVLSEMEKQEEEERASKLLQLQEQQQEQRQHNRMRGYGRPPLKKSLSCVSTAASSATPGPELEDDHVVRAKSYPLMDGLVGEENKVSGESLKRLAVNTTPLSSAKITAANTVVPFSPLTVDVSTGINTSSRPNSALASSHIIRPLPEKVSTLEPLSSTKGAYSGEVKLEQPQQLPSEMVRWDPIHSRRPQSAQISSRNSIRVGGDVAEDHRPQEVSHEMSHRGTRLTLRPSSAAAVLQRNRTADGSNADMLQETFVQPSGGRSAWAKEGVKENDRRISKVLETRNSILQKQEQDRINKLLEKQRRHQNFGNDRVTALRRQTFSVFWCLLTFVRAVRFNKKALRVVERRRSHLTMQYAARVLRAALKITRWWRGRKIRLMLIARPKALTTLGYCVRCIWAKLQVRKRRAGSTLLIHFLQDAYDKSIMMKKVYKFRRNVIKIQRWVRGWIRVQKARLQLLWFAMESVESKRNEIILQEQYKILKQSMKAMAKVEGFSSTLQQIDVVKKRLNHMLAHEDRTMKRSLQVQKEALELYEQYRMEMMMSGGGGFGAGSNINSSMNPEPGGGGGGGGGAGVGGSSGKQDNIFSASGNATPGSPTETGNNNNNNNNNNANEDLDPASGQAQQIHHQQQQSSSNIIYFSGHTNKSIFWRKIRSSRANLKKMRMLLEVLRKQRYRHTVTLEASRRRAKKDKTTVNLDGLRSFLHNSNPTLEAVNGIFVGLVDDKATKKSNWPPFLLLTQGGYDAIESIAAQLYSISK